MRSERIVIAVLCAVAFAGCRQNMHNQAKYIPLRESEFFADIIARHEVLYGPDPFIGLIVSREAALHRLLQVLVNLQLRLRERHA